MINVCQYFDMLQNYFPSLTVKIFEVKSFAEGEKDFAYLPYSDMKVSLQTEDG